MSKEAENPNPNTTPQASKLTPSPNPAHLSPSHSSNGAGNENGKRGRGEEFITSVAEKIAAQPLQHFDPNVWGVLTAISDNARKRGPGLNILLMSDEHCIGRLVNDVRFQIISPAVSAYHCKIYRKMVAVEDTENMSENCFSVFLKDSSTNGTYLNWEKLKKSSGEAILRHGDIISVAFAPNHELAFSYVYREVQKSSISHGGPLKRKADEHGDEGKRLKGIGIGSSDGPISLDDFRSLQRSNTELRKLLENQVVLVEALRCENRAATEKHENEVRDMKESLLKDYTDQLSALKQSSEHKEEKLSDLNRISAEQKHEIEDLNERLNASIQSCVEANEIISSQIVSMSELKALLDEEREQRREEREKACIDMKMVIQRVQAEAAEEIKRVSDAASRREKELQEMINKLQEADTERCLLVENLRTKLEDTRQKLVNSDNKARLLEAQLHQDQQSLASNRKTIEELELERNKIRKELENKKAAREEAWAKVSTLELEISAAIRDLDFERRKLKGARERIMLRETQLRAFYSTTEEISTLFAKQQEQLKAMRKTLEDEENYESTSIDVDLNPDHENRIRSVFISKEQKAHQSNKKAKEQGREQTDSSSGGVSVTEKHDCNSKILGNNEDTQDIDFTSTERNINEGFGSDINGIGTLHVSNHDTVGTEQIPDTECVVGTTTNFETEAVGTERVLETESLTRHNDTNIDLNENAALDEDNMQIDDRNQAQEYGCNYNISPQSNKPPEVGNPMEETEGSRTIRTTDLLASEVAGSWACSTAPSVQGENDDTPCNKDAGDENDVRHIHDDSNSLVAESQNIVSSSRSDKWNQERIALSEMIGIVAPDLKERFCGAIRSADHDVGSERIGDSNSDTEGNTDDDHDDRKGIDQRLLDDEMSETESEREKPDDDGDDDDTQED